MLPIVFVFVIVLVLALLFFFVVLPVRSFSAGVDVGVGLPLVLLVLGLVLGLGLFVFLKETQVTLETIAAFLQKHRQEFTVRVIVSPRFLVHLPLGSSFQVVCLEVSVRDALKILETNRLKFLLQPEVGTEPTSIGATLECDVLSRSPVRSSSLICGWRHRKDYESDDSKTTEEMRQKRGLIVAPASPSSAVGEAQRNPFSVFLCSFAKFIHCEKATCNGECDCREGGEPSFWPAA